MVFNETAWNSVSFNVWQLSVRRETVLIVFLTTQYVTMEGSCCFDFQFSSDNQSKFSELKRVIIITTFVRTHITNTCRQGDRNQPLWFAEKSRLEGDSTFPVSSSLHWCHLELVKQSLLATLHPPYPPYRSSSTDWCSGRLNTNACCVHLSCACRRSWRELVCVISHVPGSTSIRIKE